MNERELREEVNIGQHAQVLLDTKEIWHACDVIEKNIFVKIKACPASDIESLRTLKLQLTALAEIHRYLQKCVSNGKRAQAKIDEMHGRRKRPTGERTG